MLTRILAIFPDCFCPNVYRKFTRIFTKCFKVLRCNGNNDRHPLDGDVPLQFSSFFGSPKDNPFVHHPVSSGHAFHTPSQKTHISRILSIVRLPATSHTHTRPFKYSNGVFSFQILIFSFRHQSAPLHSANLHGRSSWQIFTEPPHEILHSASTAASDNQIDFIRRP